LFNKNFLLCYAKTFFSAFILSFVTLFTLYSCSKEEKVTTQPTKGNSTSSNNASSFNKTSDDRQYCEETDKTKEDVEGEPISEQVDKIIARYYYDNREVSEEDYESKYDSTEDEHLTQYEVTEDTSKLIVHSRGFSSKQELYEFGDDNELHIEELIEVQNHLRDTAFAENVDDYYEETGEFPDWYIEHACEYYAEKHPDMSSKMLGCDAGGFNGYYKECYVESDFTIGGTFLFNLQHSGWNNEISMYYPFEVFCQLDAVHNGPFFKKRIDLIWYQWGWAKLDFCKGYHQNIKKPWLNDRATSWIQWM